MADKKGTGLLMVWCDVPADMEDDFNRWYNEEHIAELLARPGVLSAARYVAISGSPKYLACYEMANPEVRDSAEYQGHLNQVPRSGPRGWTYRPGRPALSPTIIARSFPWKCPREVAQADMAPVLQVGRMSIPEDQEEEWNNFYNTVYAPNYEQVPGCRRFRRYSLYKGPGPKYLVVYEFENENVPQTAEWSAARAKSGGSLTETYPRMVHDEGSAGVYKKIFPL